MLCGYRRMPLRLSCGTPKHRTRAHIKHRGSNINSTASRNTHVFVGECHVFVTKRAGVWTGKLLGVRVDLAGLGRWGGRTRLRAESQTSDASTRKACSWKSRVESRTLEPQDREVLKKMNPAAGKVSGGFAACFRTAGRGLGPAGPPVPRRSRPESTMWETTFGCHDRKLAAGPNGKCLLPLLAWQAADKQPTVSRDNARRDCGPRPRPSVEPF